MNRILLPSSRKTRLACWALFLACLFLPLPLCIAFGAPFRFLHGLELFDTGNVMEARGGPWPFFVMRDLRARPQPRMECRRQGEDNPGTAAQEAVGSGARVSRCRPKLADDRVGEFGILLALLGLVRRERPSGREIHRLVVGLTSHAESAETAEPESRAEPAESAD